MKKINEFATNIFSKATESIYGSVREGLNEYYDLAIAVAMDTIIENLGDKKVIDVKEFMGSLINSMNPEQTVIYEEFTKERKLRFNMIQSLRKEL